MLVIQIIVFEKIIKLFFVVVLDEKVQQKFLRILFDLLVNCKNLYCVQIVSSVFKGIFVNVE